MDAVHVTRMMPMPSHARAGERQASLPGRCKQRGNVGNVAWVERSETRAYACLHAMHATHLAGS